jgi:hypothetical protein
VPLSVELVIHEAAQAARDLGHDVWRRPNESKLRCTAQPDPHGPPMCTSIYVAWAFDRRCSRVRLRRARADRHQTEWWRFMGIHRELMAHFDAIIDADLPGPAAKLAQPLRITAP